MGSSLEINCNVESRPKQSSCLVYLHCIYKHYRNFTNHLYSIASDILEKYNLSFDYIKPLILETANKVLQATPKDVQTGPARRHDKNTMQKHLDMLSSDLDKQELYRLISQRIVKMYDENRA